MKTLAFLVTLAGASIAHAETPTPSFELLDRGDAVEIIAHDIKATRTAIAPIRSRLEVPIAGAPAASRLFPKADGTILQVELDGAPTARVVSVKLKFEHDAVVQYARYAQAIQVGDDLHLMIPRRLPLEGTAAKLPEPTLPAVAIAKVEPAPAPVVGPPKPAEKVDEPKIETAKIAEKAPEKITDAPKAADKPATLAKVEAVKPADTTPKKPLGKAEDPQSNSTSLLLAGGLVLCGAGMWVAKRRKKNAQAAEKPTIEVIAQRSLGGKAKVVWLNAAGRDLVVSVTPQQIRMLHASAQQKDDRPQRSVGARASRPAIARAQRTEEVPSHQIIDEIPAIPAMPRTMTSRNSSPQISGLLKLREEIPSLPARPRLGTPPHPMNAYGMSDDVATDDLEADELWAKEIRAATMGSRK